MPAPFGTVAPADAMRGATKPPVSLTPAQRHVARAIMNVERGGVAERRGCSFGYGTLHDLVAMELHVAGLADTAPAPGGGVYYTLTRAAAEAALDAGERLSAKAFLPPGTVPGDI